MDLIIENIKNKEDLKFFSALAKRLGFRAKELSKDEKEEIALGFAIKEGKDSGYVEESEVLYLLDKKRKKK